MLALGSVFNLDIVSPFKYSDYGTEYSIILSNRILSRGNLECDDVVCALGFSTIQQDLKRIQTRNLRGQASHVYYRDVNLVSTEDHLSQCLPILSIQSYPERRGISASEHSEFAKSRFRPVDPTHLAREMLIMCIYIWSPTHIRNRCSVPLPSTEYVLESEAASSPQEL